MKKAKTKEKTTMMLLWCDRQWQRNVSLGQTTAAVTC